MKRGSKYDRVCKACGEVIKRCLAEGGPGDSWCEPKEGEYYHLDCRYGKK